MIFPKHNCGLYLEHNVHKDYYDSTEKAVAEIIERHGKDAMPDELAKRCIDRDSIWSLQWYPDTPIGFYHVFGSTLVEVLEKAKQIENSKSSM